MNIKVKLDEKDYIGFNYWYAKKIIIFVNVFYAFLIMIILFLLLWLPNRTFSMVIDIVALLVLVLFLVYFNIGIYFRSKKIFASDKFLQLEQTYDVTVDSISVSSERSNTLVKWDEVYSLKESQDMFAIFLGKNRAFLLPKRCMDEAAAQELRQLATSNLPPKKVKLRK